jgi:CsoR family transcriptional regulator, copper-sensing transcriptional repressor
VEAASDTPSPAAGAAGVPPVAPDPGYAAADSTAAVLRRLRRIEGQVRGIQGMIEDGRYCIDVLQQISAAQAALDKVALALVDDHARHCILGSDPETQEARHAELMATLARMVGRR